MKTSKKPPVNNFEWIEDTSQSDKYFIKSYKGQSDAGYLREVGVWYTEKLLELQNDLPFIPEKMKIEKSVKLLTNLHDKTACVIYIGNLKQALNHGLNFKKFHRVIKFN